MALFGKHCHIGAALMPPVANLTPPNNESPQLQYNQVFTLKVVPEWYVPAAAVGFARIQKTVSVDKNPRCAESAQAKAQE